MSQILMPEKKKAAQALLIANTLRKVDELLPWLTDSLRIVPLVSAYRVHVTFMRMLG